MNKSNKSPCSILLKTCGVAFLLACVSSGVFLSPAWPAQAQINTAAGSPPARLNVAALQRAVTVRRDERGVPYIEAQNESDLYIAQGYVTASDRLWQMDLLRRVARGEVSEILGEFALEEDKLHRRYGFAGLAGSMMSALSARARSALESYTVGVNAYIQSCNDRTLPQEFLALKYKPRPWQPEDSLLVGKLFAEMLSTSWNVDMVRESISDLPEDVRRELLLETSPLDVVLVGADNDVKQNGKAHGMKPRTRHAPARADVLDAGLQLAEVMRRSLERVGLYAEGRAASNNWVVSGSRSVSGKPLLANDPHLHPSAPSIWYLTHLSTPSLRVAGVASPGLPGIVIGHNEHIAWGATNLGPDVQDLYLEKFDPKRPSFYLTPAGLREATIRHEEIKVRKKPGSAEFNTVQFDVTITRHGPILIERQGKRYALRWTALEPLPSELEAFYFINRSRNWKEFSAALSRYPGPAQNFVYADAGGNIGYYGAGRIPIRKKGDGSVPYDGSTDDGEWVGFIPFDRLPHLYNPPSGLIVTANNRIVGSSYPFHLTHAWADPHRARRIFNLLTAKPKLSLEDFRAIQGDTYAFSISIFTGEIVKMASAKPDSPEWQAIKNAFGGWDSMAVADSKPMALAATLRRIFRQKILTAKLGPRRANQYFWGNVTTFLNNVLSSRSKAWLPSEFDSYESLILSCYRDAQDQLKNQLGDESQWTWGRLSPMRFFHPLASESSIGQRFAIGPIGQVGGVGIVNAGSEVSMRLLVDTADWDRTRQGIALGQSGDPLSPHWKDQLDSWLKASPPPLPFTEKAVKSSAKETILLMPVSP
ncbi:MAG TPA: penicillin acylase family protein [Blastocatellia bacterium]